MKAAPAGLEGNGSTAFRFWLKITLRLAKRSGPRDTERDRRKQQSKRKRNWGETRTTRGRENWTKGDNMQQIKRCQPH